MPTNERINASIKLTNIFLKDEYAKLFGKQTPQTSQALWQESISQYPNFARGINKIKSAIETGENNISKHPEWKEPFLDEIKEVKDGYTRQLLNTIYVARICPNGKIISEERAKVEFLNMKDQFNLNPQISILDVFYHYCK